MNLTISNFNDFVLLAGDKIITDTRLVAKAFRKQHHHVVQKVESLECSAEFLTSNFSRVEYEHRGNRYAAYEMTKDGFVMLVMSFTGRAAMAIKEAYINAFNAMADHIRQQSATAWQEYRTAAIEFAKGRDTASLCGRGLNRWRMVKRGLENRLERLEAEIQPTLFLG